MTVPLLIAQRRSDTQTTEQVTTECFLLPAMANRHQ